MKDMTSCSRAAVAESRSHASTVVAGRELESQCELSLSSTLHSFRMTPYESILVYTLLV
jgi:hypothetical protein